MINDLKPHVDLSWKNLKELEAKTGVNWKTIKEWFTHGKDPKLSNFIKVANAVGMIVNLKGTVDELSGL